MKKFSNPNHNAWQSLSAFLILGPFFPPFGDDHKNIMKTLQQNIHLKNGPCNMLYCSQLVNVSSFCSCFILLLFIFPFFFVTIVSMSFHSFFFFFCPNKVLRLCFFLLFINVFLTFLTIGLFSFSLFFPSMIVNYLY